MNVVRRRPTTTRPIATRNALHSWLAGLALLLAACAISPALADEPYARSRDYDLQHSKIAMRFDVEKKEIFGDVTHSLTVLRDNTAKHLALSAEMLRVLRPGGFMLWYDFFVNNPSNPDVRGVGKSEIARLFPGCDIELARITVAAPLGRAIARPPYIYATLAACRIFCTHYLGWIRKR